MKLKRIALLLMLVLVASVIAACGGDDDDDGDDGGDASAQSSDLSQTLSEGGITVSYPEGWVAEGDIDGLTLASDQETFDQANASTDAPELPDGGTALQVSILPSDAFGGSPAEIFDLLFGEGSEDDLFAPGERSDLTIGDRSGVTAPLEFTGDTDLSGALYILTYDEGNILLGIGIGGGDTFNTGVAESILGTVDLTEEEAATEEPDDVMEEEAETEG